MTILFYTLDAVAFSYAVRQKQITRSDKAGGIYRDHYHIEPLLLNGEDPVECGGAPLSFTVIDTSNLIDYVGAINLVVATAPLLDHKSSYSLCTQKLGSDICFCCPKVAK
jgi:hypothetical protein